MCPGKEYQHELGIGTKIRYCEDIQLFLLWVVRIGVVMSHTDQWNNVDVEREKMGSFDEIVACKEHKKIRTSTRKNLWS